MSKRIKLENLEVAGFKSALRGMRNPMNSHHLSDTVEDWHMVAIGANDLDLAVRLIKAGPSHRKFLRQIMIWVDITACLKWWDEFDTYLHTVKNSTSQMHKLGNRELTQYDFSSPIPDVLLNLINEKISVFAKERTPESWREMIDVIPQSFLYTRTTMMSYECFLTMYPNRKNHKMEEWREFCVWGLERLPYMEKFINPLEETNENKDITS